MANVSDVKYLRCQMYNIHKMLVQDSSRYLTGLFNNYCTVSRTICLLDITECGITISISQYHNIKAICSLFDLCHNIESSASPSCFLHFQFHLITGSGKHKIIKTVTKTIGRIGDLSVNI